MEDAQDINGHIYNLRISTLCIGGDIPPIKIKLWGNIICHVVIT